MQKQKQNLKCSTLREKTQPNDRNNKNRTKISLSLPLKVLLAASAKSFSSSPLCPRDEGGPTKHSQKGGK